MGKVTSAEDYKLLSSFEAVRRTLMEAKYEDRLDKPLAYWALPNDRRLPLAFLGRTLRDLLDRPFDELSATPGIGQKKISSLVKLLLRATKEEPPMVPFGISDLAAEEVEDELPSESGFDASQVSEALWVRWKDTVRRHGVEHEKLGRLAPALADLPTVIWHTPLSFYMDKSVAEIRELKTHGEKRVRVVLEVFHAVHESLQSLLPPRHLATQLVPRFVPPIESWVNYVMENGHAPSDEEVREHLALPLLAQLKLDAGETVYKLAEGRLGVRGKMQSVRDQSRKLGVTRARVYQLLDDCGRVMTVRWPEGRVLLAKLIEKLSAEGQLSPQPNLLATTRELFFPEKFGEEYTDEAEAVAAAEVVSV